MYKAKDIETGKWVYGDNYYPFTTTANYTVYFLQDTEKKTVFMVKGDSIQKVPNTLKTE